MLVYLVSHLILIFDSQLLLILFLNFFLFVPVTYRITGMSFRSSPKPVLIWFLSTRSCLQLYRQLHLIIFLIPFIINGTATLFMDNKLTCYPYIPRRSCIVDISLWALPHFSSHRTFFVISDILYQ